MIELALAAMAGAMMAMGAAQKQKRASYTVEEKRLVLNLVGGVGRGASGVAGGSGGGAVGPAPMALAREACLADLLTESDADEAS